MDSTDHAINFYTIYCSGCGEFLTPNQEHADPCSGVIGTYCTQCGQPVHKYVCYPDARKLEDAGLTQVSNASNKQLKPLW